MLAASALVFCKSFAKIFFMRSEQKRELAEIRKLATRLLRRIEAFEKEPQEAHEPPEVAAKVANRICLGCGIKVPEGDPYRRGLHEACYHTTMRRIRDGEWSEFDRIEAGKLAKTLGKAGRPAAIDVADASETIAQAIADQIAPRKTAEPKEKTDKKTKRSK